MLSDLDLLNSSEQDVKWFQQNSLVIQKEFANKLVAIKDEKIVASAGNIEQLLSLLKQKEVDESEVLVEFIIPKGEIVIL